MLNGCLQVLNTGIVPGNRNADNVDKVMEDFDLIVYPSRTIQTDGVKAFSVTSFGFGQKGAQAIGIHPRYLFATLDRATFDAYAAKVEARQKKAYSYFHNGMINNTLFVAKSESPYTDDQLRKVLLNPDARVTADATTGKFAFAPNFAEQAAEARTDSSKMAVAQEMAEALMLRSQPQPGADGAATPSTRVGVDVEDISAVPSDNATFVERNFTAAEVAYCEAAASPRSSFAGRWSAKEAVFKSLGVASLGAGAPLKDIEIVKNEAGVPEIKVSWCWGREVCLWESAS
jgi:fatty acid synthase subunit alpha